MAGWCKFTFSSNCRKIQSLELSILFFFSVYNKPKLQNFPPTYTCVKIFYKISKLHKVTIIHKLSDWTIRQNIQQDYSVTQNFDYNTQTYTTNRASILLDYRSYLLPTPLLPLSFYLQLHKFWGIIFIGLLFFPSHVSLSLNSIHLQWFKFVKVFPVFDRSTISLLTYIKSKFGS